MLTSCELLLLYIRTSVLSWITNICRTISQTAAKRAWSPKVAVDRIVTESVVATKQLARYQDDAHAGGADRCDLYKIKYDFCLLQYKMRNMKQCFLYSNWSGALHAHNIIAYILNNSHLHSYSESHNIPINQITSGKWSDRELGARRDCTLFFALNKPNHCSIPAQCYIILYVLMCARAQLTNNEEFQFTCVTRRVCRACIYTTNRGKPAKEVHSWWALLHVLRPNCI